MTALARRLRDLVTALPEHSQQRARLNALAGCTELAERRRELADVEEFLAALTAPEQARPA
jgi:hypothetical protein